ncbi:DUF308 domain-containing protein [Haloplanus sp. GCM10025708]|uniref:DUF7344 domain-containing protein n=1 Tax=Haloferacaceae TaxID=1644056 RepID=UPI003616EE65
MLGKGEHRGATDEWYADESDADDESERTLDEPTEHEIFDIIANRRRRYALRALAGSNSGISLGALAERVAARENGTTVDRVSTDERKRVYTALQQSHIPKMERTGVVRFDQETARVVPTTYLDAVDQYLDAGGAGTRRWNRYYLALALVAGGVVAACAAGVAPFTTLGWFALSVVALSVIALAHTYSARSTGANDASVELDR